MIEGVVHAVNTDDVDTELLQVGDITRTPSGVGQWVYKGGGLEEGVVRVISGLAWMPVSQSCLTNTAGKHTLWLVCDTLDVEPRTVSTVQTLVVREVSLVTATGKDAHL